MPPTPSAPAPDPSVPAPTTTAGSRAADASGAAADWPADLESILQAALPEFLLRQRWYPAKDAGRPEVSVRVLEPIAVPGIPAAAGVWRVQAPGRAPLHLFVTVALVPEDSADPSQVIARPPATGGEPARVLVEGFSSDAFTRSWLAEKGASAVKVCHVGLCVGQRQDVH